MTTPINVEERELEGLAMSVIFQAGDLLYETLPKDIAHDHFVDARQATNDKLIDFTKGLVSTYITNKLIEELESFIRATHGEYGHSILEQQYLGDRIAALRATLSNTIEGESNE